MYYMTRLSNFDVVLIITGLCETVEFHSILKSEI